MWTRKLNISLSMISHHIIFYVTASAGEQVEASASFSSKFYNSFSLCRGWEHVMHVYRETSWSNHIFVRWKFLMLVYKLNAWFSIVVNIAEQQNNIFSCSNFQSFIYEDSKSRAHLSGSVNFTPLGEFFRSVSKIFEPLIFFTKFIILSFSWNDIQQTTDT